MKSARNLLIPFFVMILLGIGVVVFFFVDRFMKAPEGTTKASTVDLLYINPVDVSSVKVLHRDAKLTVKVDKKNTVSGSYVYTYSGDDKSNDNYSQGKMDEFVSRLTSFVSCIPVSSNAALSEFGLDDPAYTITIEKSDGSSSSICIGNLSPEGDYCYICVKGISSVYLTSVNQYRSASSTGNDFIDSSVLCISMSEIESVRFIRQKDSVDLLAQSIYDNDSESFSFKFIEPFEIKSSEYFDRMIEHICSLEAIEYEDASFENLTKFKLSNPDVSFSFKTKDLKENTVIFSSKINGCYYGRLNDTGKIFKIESDRIESLESPILKLIDNYIFYDRCDNVDSIECSSSDGKFAMKLDVDKGNAISDDRSTVTLDGRNAKVISSTGRSYAAMLYESIFCINIGGIDAGATIGSSAVPVTTITIYDRNHSSVVYAFYKRNDDSYYVCRNGQYTKFYVYGRELYNDGGTNTYDYGLWPAYEILTKAITEQINGVYDIPEKQ